MKKILKLLILLNVFLCANLFASKSLYLSYSKIPTNIYKNQKFEGQKIEIPKSDYEGNVWLLHFFIILLLITYAIPAKVDITNSLPSFLQTTYFFKIVLLLVYFESIEFFENKFINRSNFFRHGAFLLIVYLCIFLW